MARSRRWRARVFEYDGDDVPATAAQLNFPAGVAATADGGFLIADNDNHRIRRVSAGSTITTVAGTGVRGAGGDDGPATLAQINDPAGVAATADGGYLIADKDNHRIRRVSATGTITTAAGAGTLGSVETAAGNGGAAQQPVRGRAHRRRRLPDRGRPQPPRAAGRAERHDHNRGGYRRCGLLG